MGENAFPYGFNHNSAAVSVFFMKYGWPHCCKEPFRYSYLLPLQLSAIFDCYFEVVYLNGIRCTVLVKYNCNSVTPIKLL